jgi:toluene monooxygenase system ferredoxin subunit
VTPERALWDGEMQGHVVAGRRVLLVKLDGRVCAYEDRCAHLGVPLSEGRLAGGVIECKAHQYRYDARTGCGVNPKNVRLRALEVAIDDGIIAVDPGGRE